MINLQEFLEPILSNEDNQHKLAYGDEPLLIDIPDDWSRQDIEHVMLGSRLHHNLFMTQDRDTNRLRVIYRVPTGDSYKPRDYDLTYKTYREYLVMRAHIYEMAAEFVREHINDMRRGESAILAANGLNKTQVAWLCDYLRKGGLEVSESHTSNKLGGIGLVGAVALPFSQWVIPE